MGLDITFKELKEIRCPDCGKLVTTQVVSEVDSSGREWYLLLESFDYYIPYEKRTDENDIWYGKDMVLGDEKVTHLQDFLSKRDIWLYNNGEVKDLVERALESNNKIAVNADW